VSKVETGLLAKKYKYKTNATSKNITTTKVCSLLLYPSELWIAHVELVVKVFIGLDGVRMKLLVSSSIGVRLFYPDRNL
jgi:hypothetical protein